MSSVLVIPVPELNEWVLERTAFYDASFLPADPSFVNAHITVLGPWLDRPTGADLAVVAEIVASTAPFSFKLAEIATFPDGLVYLDPEPSEPFAELTSRLVEAFPACPPYGGTFASVVPHLTLDQLSPDISVESVRASLGAAIPTLAHADRLDLQWWENDRCHLMRSWSLGG